MDKNTLLGRVCIYNYVLITLCTGYFCYCKRTELSLSCLSTEGLKANLETSKNSSKKIYFTALRRIQVLG